jgi:hypothetical protein
MAGLSYKEMLGCLSDTKRASRGSWDTCKVIRNARESDIDYINYPIENILVSDCDMARCDCKIAIYNPSKEDLEAKDWMI